MRALYAKRQARLFTLVQEHLSDVLKLVPCEAGMQVAGWFVNDLDDRAGRDLPAEHAGAAMRDPSAA